MKNPFDTPERAAYRETLAKFVAAEIAPHVDEWDEAGAIPWEVHEKLGALGFFGFGIDEKYGGLGFDDSFMRKDGAVELSKCGATGVGAAVGGRNISTAPIAMLASEEIKMRALPDILSGRKGARRSASPSRAAARTSPTCRPGRGRTATTMSSRAARPSSPAA